MDEIPSYYKNFVPETELVIPQTAQKLYGIPQVSSRSSDRFSKLKYSPTAKIETNVSPFTDASIIARSFKGEGSYSQAFNSILPHRTQDHIIQICQEFEKIDKKPLWKRIKEDIFDPYKYIVMTLVHPPVSKLSYVLYNALVECGKNEKDIDAMIYILVSHTEEEIDQAEAQYNKSYHDPVSKQIKIETTGFIQKALIALLEKKRTSDISDDQLNHIVKLLTTHGNMTDGMKDQLIQILCKSSISVIHKIIKEYEKITHKSLEEKFSNEDKFEKCLRSIVCYASEPARYHALYLHEGVQQKDAKKISNVLTLHYTTDLGHIADSYNSIFFVPLLDELTSTFMHQDYSSRCFRELLGAS